MQSRFPSKDLLFTISELLEYNVEVKERDHAVDGILCGIALKSTAPLIAFRFG